MVKCDIKTKVTEMHGSADVIEAEIAMLIATFLREIIIDDNNAKSEVATRLLVGAIGMSKNEELFDGAEKQMVIIPKIKRKGGEDIE